MLLEALYSVIKSTSSLAASEQNSLIRLMGLRESILEHVTALLAREPSERKLIETNRKERSQISRERFANCVDMALELCLMLPKLRKVAAKVCFLSNHSMFLVSHFQRTHVHIYSLE